MKCKHKYFLFIPAFVVYLLIVYSSCSDNPVEPPPPEPPKAVSLKLVDVSCTEAFIKVTVADSVLPLNISLSKDDSTIANFTLTKTDTVIIDTTLQPNIIYTYQTTEVINSKEENSDTLQVKTLPTTSNNFTWQTCTFGNPNYGSCVLNDVAIIDENNIWAVGEIYMNDSNSNPGFITIQVYDVLGKEVARLADGIKAAGNHQVEFQAGQLPSGIYFYELKAGIFRETKKMILTK